MASRHNRESGWTRHTKLSACRLGTAGTVAVNTGATLPTEPVIETPQRPPRGRL